MVDWAKLVEEHNAWVAHNFPPKPGEIPGRVSIMGVIEEVGELTHAHLKQDQQIRMNEDHEANARDAIGDITVYLLGVMNAHGLPTGSRMSPGFYTISDATDALFAIATTASDLGFYEIYNGDRFVVEPPETMYDLVCFLDQYCKLRGWNYDEIITETWNAVKQRDWIAYPNTGLPPVEVFAQELEDDEPAIWTCKIGGADRAKLPYGADSPLRRAVQAAYKEVTGENDEYCFSGWGGQLTQGEQEVVTPAFVEDTGASWLLSPEEENAREAEQPKWGMDGGIESVTTGQDHDCTRDGHVLADSFICEICGHDVT